ncbi:putative leucine-rich repeat receptor-like protein kinase [Quercus suber]|uniref:Leucine-rich repeat receptor-like protein kinase n=1 Tax=Quercus suber TaxID=58331 RepID=A0AAW0LE72_QUESU
MDIATGSMAAYNSSALEGKALLENGWWSGESTDTSLNHCVWFGIKCNDGRSAIEIDMARVDSVFHLGDEGDEFSKLNFSSFPNLVRLNVSYYGLRGSIPVEIGTLSKLTHLDLSHNYLTVYTEKAEDHDFFLHVDVAT